MEPSKAEMAPSPTFSDAQILPFPQAESQLSSLIYDLSQQVQEVMDNMLKMISEIDQNSAGVMEEMEKSKESALERKKVLEEEKEGFQKAAYTVLEMFNHREI